MAEVPDLTWDFSFCIISHLRKIEVRDGGDCNTSVWSPVLVDGSKGPGSNGSVR